MSIDVRYDLGLIEDELIALRRDLHSHPELSGREYRTAGIIRRYLDEVGAEWTEVGGTGTYAEIHGAEGGDDIMLRADIDALPVTEKSRYPYPSQNDGVMHACGHDIHTAALIGAVKILSKHSDKLRGNVKIVFQQAEESGHGSQYFVDAGLTEGVDRIYGFHVSPYDRAGAIAVTDDTDAASCDRMTIRLKGTASHITRPHLGSDALAAASDIVTRLRQLQSETDPIHRILVGIGTVRAGTAWNVLADSAEIDGSIRALSVRAREDALSTAERIIKNTAALHGVTAEVSFELNAPCLVNDKDAYKTMIQAASDTVGCENVVKRDAPLGFGADDFSAFSERIKGCFAHIGTAEEDEDTSLALHSDRIYINDRAVITGAELLARCALLHLEMR